MKKLLPLLIASLFFSSTTWAQNTAADLDGTDANIVVDSSNFSLSGLTAVSYTMWVNADWSSGNNYLLDFADGGGYGAGSNGMRFLLGEFQNQIRMYFYFEQNNTQPVSTGNIAQTANEWIHVAAVIDAGRTVGNTTTYNIEIFINGESEATGTKDVTSPTAGARDIHLSNGSNLRLGSRWNEQTNSYMEGSLDNVMIYDRALTAAEINDMACDGTGPTNGRIIYYNFNEGTGSTTFDLSGGGHDGNLQGGYTWGQGVFNGFGSQTPATGFREVNNSPTLQVRFINETVGGADYLWTFGDGDSSTANNPLHTYDQEGKYNVCLTAENVCGNAAAPLCQEVTIDCPKAVAAYVHSAEDRKVTFEADTNGITNFTWSFDDGSQDISGPNNGSISKIFSSYGSYEVCLYVSSPCGVDTLCETISVFASGIAENNHDNAWKIYPNPSQGILHINTLQSFEGLAIRDLSGRVVYQLDQSFDSELSLDLSGLESGVYFVEVNAGQDLSRKQWIKE